MALRSGWSRFHFHRAFRRLVGETPKQYLLRIRLERAAAALTATDAPLLAVSRTAGLRAMRYLHARSVAISAALRNATVATRSPVRRNRLVHATASSC